MDSNKANSHSNLDGHPDQTFNESLNLQMISIQDIINDDNGGFFSDIVSNNDSQNPQTNIEYQKADQKENNQQLHLNNESNNYCSNSFFNNLPNVYSNGSHQNQVQQQQNNVALNNNVNGNSQNYNNNYNSNNNQRYNNYNNQRYNNYNNQRYNNYNNQPQQNNTHFGNNYHRNNHQFVQNNFIGQNNNYNQQGNRFNNSNQGFDNYNQGFNNNNQRFNSNNNQGFNNNTNQGFYNNNQVQNNNNNYGQNNNQYKVQYERQGQNNQNIQEQTMNNIRFNNNNNNEQNNNDNGQNSQRNDEYNNVCNNNQSEVYDWSNNNNNNLQCNNRNNAYTNNNSESNWIKDGPMQVGKFLKEEVLQFIHRKGDNNVFVNERIYIHNNQIGKAIHGSIVNFYYVRKASNNYQNNNQRYYEFQKAIIHDVIEYPSYLNNMIGQFGFIKDNSKPCIDFDIQNKTFDSSQESELYFYPLELFYPTMKLSLPDSIKIQYEETLFKKYFVVRFIGWAEDQEIPLVEIVDTKGNLYELTSDCEALFHSFKIHINKAIGEDESIEQTQKQYQTLLSESTNEKRQYLQTQIFTIDHANSSEIENGISFQRISTDILEQEINAQKAVLKNQNKDNMLQEIQFEYSISQNYEEQKENNDQIKEIQELNNNLQVPQLENLKEQEVAKFQNERRLFQLGIHVSDFSECIVKNSALYNGLKQREESISVELEGDQFFERNLFDQSLLHQFSLKKGEERLAKSLFICLEAKENGTFEFVWETSHFQNTIIKVDRNYSYQEFDSLAHGNDSSVQNCCLSVEEYSVLKKLGEFLYDQREKRGQTVFDEEKINYSESVSSQLVQECMIFYNQLMSKAIAVKNHMSQQFEEVKKNCIEQRNTYQKDISEYQVHSQLIEENISQINTLLQDEQMQLKNLNESIEKIESILQNSDTNFLEKKNLSLIQSKRQQEDLVLEYKKLQWLDESKFESATQTKQKKNDNKVPQKSNEKKQKQKKEQPKPKNNKQKTTQNKESENQNQTKKVSIFTQKKIIYQNKITTLSQQLFSLQKDSMFFNQKINSLNQSRDSYVYSNLKKINKYVTFCELVGFKEFKFKSLHELSESITKLKYSEELEKVKRNYLLFFKDQIIRELIQYHYVIDREINHQQTFEKKYALTQEQISKLNSEITKTNEVIWRTEKMEELEMQIESSEQVLQEIKVDLSQEPQSVQQVNQEENTHKRGGQDIDGDSVNLIEEASQLSGKAKALYELKSKIAFKQKIIDSLESQIMNHDSKIERTHNNLQRQIVMKTQLEKLIKERTEAITLMDQQKEDINTQINLFKTKLDEPLDSLFQQLVQEANKIFNIIPETANYLCLTSPIRKFSNIINQQFVGKYYGNQMVTTDFTESYKSIKKQNMFQMRNARYFLIKKFYEKIQKMRDCRRMLQNNVPKLEKVLQVKRQLFDNNLRYSFFTQDELQEIVFEANRSSEQQVHSDFSILDGYVYCRKQLPYDYVITEVGLVNQNDNNLEVHIQNNNI